MGAFISQFQHDVFVSYARVDNVPLIVGDDGTRWVSNLKGNLQTLLDQKLGRANSADIWMDLQGIEGHRPFPEAIGKAVTSSATLLVVMSDGYLNSSWCETELKQFVQAIGEENVAGRIFVVYREDISYDCCPPVLQHLNGYPFFLKDPINDVTRPLAIPKPKAEEEAYFIRLFHLCFQLSNQLRSLRTEHEGQEQAVVATNGNSPAVLLAEVTPDLFEERKDVESHLQRSGITVLPRCYYNRAPASFQREMERDLNQSKLFVQLLGPYATPRTPDLPHGYEGLQLERARAAAKTILRWRRHDLNLDAVLEDDHRRELQSPDVMATELEGFKRIITNSIRSISSQRKLTYEERAEDAKNVLLIATTEDLPLAEGIAERLKDWNIGIDIIDETYSVIEVAAKYTYDALLVVYGLCSPLWAVERVRDCRQLAVEQGALTPVGSVYIGPPENQPRLSCRPSCFQEIYHHDKASFRQFVDAVLASFR